MKSSFATSTRAIATKAVSARLPFYKTKKFQVSATLMVLGGIIYGGKKGWDWFIAYQNRKVDQKNAISLEALKAKNRREEENLRHKHEMELQEKKAQDARDIQRQKTEDKMKVNDHKKGLNIFDADDEDEQPLRSENMQDLADEEIDENEHIMLLSNTIIQNRDIMALYGPPGVGKTQYIIDTIAKITGGNPSLVLTPVQTGVDMPYKAIYYDKEMGKDGFKQKIRGRKDLDNVDYVSCRDMSIQEVLSDLKKRLKKNPNTNYLIVIDPITNFDIPQKQIHQFVNRLNNLQENELDKGRNIAIFLGSHPVKSPRGKGLQDMGGSKYWGEAVKTVVSMTPYGPKDKYRRIRFDKARYGEEFVCGSEFIMRFEKKPYAHNVCDPMLNEGWTSEGYVNENEGTSEINRPLIFNPNCTGVISKVPQEIQERMQIMKDEEGKTYAQIAKETVPELHLTNTHVERIIKGVRKAKGLSNPPKQTKRA